MPPLAQYTASLPQDIRQSQESRAQKGAGGSKGGPKTNLGELLLQKWNLSSQSSKQYSAWLLKEEGVAVMATDVKAVAATTFRPLLQFIRIAAGAWVHPSRLCVWPHINCASPIANGSGTAQHFLQVRRNS